MINGFGKYMDATYFAAQRHRHQTRKGKERIPYINHPVRVALVLTECGETDFDLLSAAVLHDVIEDTAKDKQEIEKLSCQIKERYGETVLSVVLEVTDDKSLPVEERKRLQVMHTPTLSDRAKKLKIADKISNIQDIAVDPPEDWPVQRKLDYLNWAKNVVEGAKGINNKLDRYFDRVYTEVHSKLKNH